MASHPACTALSKLPEVDGMGGGDRGGNAAIIKMIGATRDSNARLIGAREPRFALPSLMKVFSLSLEMPPILTHVTKFGQN